MEGHAEGCEEHGTFLIMDARTCTKWDIQFVNFNITT